ncbi:MAG: hypothetical protein JXR62_00150 [Bacilli bacterium]|nr:hypothetical protein [Bacilli bacterium]
MKKTIFPKLSYIIIYGLLMGFIITSIVVIIAINSDRYFLNGVIGLNNDYFYLIAVVVLVPLFGFLFVFNRRIEIFEREIHLREKYFSTEVTVIPIDEITQLEYYDFDKDKRSAYKIHISTSTKIIYIPVKTYRKVSLAQLGVFLIEKNSNIVLDDLYKDIIRIYVK